MERNIIESPKKYIVFRYKTAEKNNSKSYIIPILLWNKIEKIETMLLKEIKNIEYEFVIENPSGFHGFTLPWTQNSLDYILKQENDDDIIVDLYPIKKVELVPEGLIQKEIILVEKLI